MAAVAMVAFETRWKAAEPASVETGAKLGREGIGQTTPREYTKEPD